MKFPIKALKCVIVWIVGFLLLYLIIPKAFSFLQPMIIAWIISLIGFPIVRLLEKKLKLKKQITIFFLTIIVLALILFIFYLIISSILNECYKVIQSLPIIYNNIEGFYFDLISFIEKSNERFPIFEQYVISPKEFNIIDMLPSSSKVMNEISNYIKLILDSAKSLPNAIINVIFVILFSILFVFNNELIDNIFNNFLEKLKIKNTYVQITSKLKDVLGGYILAQIKLLFITFVIVFIGFWIMRMDFKLLLSLLIGVLDMLPFFGTGTILGPMVVIYLINARFDLAIGCALIYIVTFIARRVLEPKFVGNSVGISSLSACFYMFIGYRLLGVLGLILGVPIGVIVYHLYKEHLFDSFISALKDIFKYFIQFAKY